MKECILFMLIGLVVVSPAFAQKKAPPLVPQILQGDWLVPSQPSPYSGLPDQPAITLRIDASNFIHRTHKDSSTKGAWDESGESLKIVKDDNGKEYLEVRPFFITIRTNSVPWQIDLWRKANDGSRVEKKGICSLQNNILTLALGYIGKPRPTSFDDPGIGGSYTVMKATLVPKP